MVVKMTEGNPSPAGATVERTVTIEGRSKTLDAIVGAETVKEETETPEPASEPKVKATEDAPDNVSADGSSDGDEPQDPKSDTTKESKVKETKPEPAAADPSDEEDENVDLGGLFLDVEGQSKSVQELINERDILKKQFDQIAKDPFLKGFIDHYMTTGDASAYLEAKGVDWDKKDDVEVLRTKFEKDNADLDQKVREKLWKRKLADEYKIKSDLTQEEMESEDYEIAQGLLKRDAKKARDEFKETQKKFQVVDRKQEEKPQQKFDPEAYKKQVLAEKEVDSFMKSKLLKLGVKSETGQSFGFEPSNPSEIIEMMADDRKFWNTIFNSKNRTVDRVKQAKIYAYAMNPDEFEQQLVDFGKTLGLEERLKEVKNTDGRLTKKTTEAQTSQKTFAKAFLTAALKQKNKQT